MKLQLPITWKEARKTVFNADKVRRESTRIIVPNVSKLRVVTRARTQDIEAWVLDSEITNFKMYGLYDDQPTKMYWIGNAFDFEDVNEAVMFKLRWI